MPMRVIKQAAMMPAYPFLYRSRQDLITLLNRLNVEQSAQKWTQNSVASSFFLLSWMAALDLPSLVLNLVMLNIELFTLLTISVISLSASLALTFADCLKYASAAYFFKLGLICTQAISSSNSDSSISGYYLDTSWRSLLAVLLVICGGYQCSLEDDLVEEMATKGSNFQNKSFLSRFYRKTDTHLAASATLTCWTNNSARIDLLWNLVYRLLTFCRFREQGMTMRSSAEPFILMNTCSFLSLYPTFSQMFLSWAANCWACWGSTRRGPISSNTMQMKFWERTSSQQAGQIPPSFFTISSLQVTKSLVSTRLV